MSDPRIAAIPDVHGHAKGEHRPYSEERPIAYSARMLFLWFYHACRRTSPRFLMVADHANYLTFEDPGAVNTVRRALKLAQAGDLLGAAETAGVDVPHAAVVSEGLRRGMRFSIGAEIDNDPRARPDAQNIVDAMRPDGIIRSVHFVPIQHPEKGADWLWPFDNEEFANLHDVVGPERLWELYIAKLVDDLEKLPTHVVGHFYVPATFGRWPEQKKLEEYEDRMLEVAHQRGLAVEINTRFLYRDHPDDRKKKYLEANARLMRKAKARGVGIAIGSDAHSPKDQGNAFDVDPEAARRCEDQRARLPGRRPACASRAASDARAPRGRSQSASPAERPGSSITGFSRAELGLPEQPELATRAARRSRAGRDAGSKRAPAPASASTSRRSADSASSASKAKAARAVKPSAPPPKKKTVKTPPVAQKRTASAAKVKKPADQTRRERQSHVIDRSQAGQQAGQQAGEEEKVRTGKAGVAEEGAAAHRAQAEAHARPRKEERQEERQKEETRGEAPLASTFS